MIGSLLVANRGEIAVRIIRTCRRLGIRTIAVFSDADRDAQHVAIADEAVRIGPAAARDSYLRAEAIMEAAARSGAEAIHPGYGFLSEKPDLPLLCRQARPIFVGPSAECITTMGPKIGSKLIAEKAGVPSVPGYAGEDQSNAVLADAAARIGYPVMIKASAGGGGKGMRRVFSAQELAPALEMARAEAQAAFGDPALLIEKLVMRPRHLEVQVAGDRHGNVVHLFERDCSVQRNNQKVLEEAPAPNLAPAIRAKLLERGVALAKAIGYDNLGTVEFILEDGFDEPWFLEMNTRLQVEHPVTEAITGYDLVEWQIRIAAGERLPALQHEIRESGHAIEARITAERADQGFRPDTGRIEGYAEPASIRVDSGVRAGSEVTLFYDSLLAKAIAAGPDRRAACARLAAGLRDFAILGPATALPFLIDAVEHPLFVEGKATTRFIDEAFPEGWAAKRSRQRLARAVAALLWLEQQKAARPQVDAWDRLAGFRLLAPAGGVATSHLLAGAEDGATKLEVRLLPNGRQIVLDPGGEIELALRIGSGSFELTFEDRLLRGSHAASAGDIRLTLDGETFTIRIGSEARPAAATGSGGAGSGAVLAPMPGVVAEVRVAPGDRVEAGQVVIVLESMKLFTSLPAGVGGVVTDIAYQQGDTVQAGKRVLLIEPSSGS